VPLQPTPPATPIAHPMHSDPSRHGRVQGNQDQNNQGCLGRIGGHGRRGRLDGADWGGHWEGGLQSQCWLCW
jgi:hypothetical protein